jgi:aspartyl protease family protein
VAWWAAPKESGIYDGLTLLPQTSGIRACGKSLAAKRGRQHGQDEPHGAHRREGGGMIGWALRQLLIWSAMGLLFYAIGSHLSKPDPAAPSSAASAPAATPRQAQGAIPNSLIYRANKQGHVVVEGVVNGAPVRFLVDTGATMVVLTTRDAAAAGVGNLVFSMRTSTANGIARAAPVKLREVRLGQLSIDDVSAAVVENLSVSLLGQSFLTRLDSYAMRDGVLTLNYW